MDCAGCRRPIGRDDHLIAVAGGRLQAGLQPWCQACFFSRSFGGRSRWFAAFDQPCECRATADTWVTGACHAWAHDNLDVVLRALRQAPSFVPHGARPPRLPAVRAYNALGRCVLWSP